MESVIAPLVGQAEKAPASGETHPLVAMALFVLVGLALSAAAATFSGFDSETAAALFAVAG